MNKQGFNSARIAEELKCRIQKGTIGRGTRMASVRAFSREFGCAPLTAHRALKLLAKDGLVAAEARYGYRVTDAREGLRGREVVAFLEDTRDHEVYLGDVYEAQLGALRRGALARGWVAAVLPYQGQNAECIGLQLEEMAATALVLQDIGERFPAGLVSMLAKLGLPVVCLDRADGESGMDQVLRDEAHGAGLAVEYLLSRGHRKLGWYGPLESTVNARRRASGAIERLMREGLRQTTHDWQDVPLATETAVARAYLQRSDRPTAVLALWQTAAQAIARASRELGLKLGKDLDVVGWALEDQLGKSYPADCPELIEACSTVTWSLTDVCKQVLNRIDERRRAADSPTASILLPMKLLPPSGRRAR